MKAVLAAAQRLIKTTGLGALVGFFVLVLAAWIFLGVASEVAEGETQSFDERVILAARDPGDPSRLRGPPIVTEMVRDITALGGLIVVTLIALLSAVFLLLSGHRRAFAFVAVSLGGGTVLSLGLKHLYARPRPALVPHLSEVMTSSFPSGHSTLSAVVYLTAAALLSRLVSRRWQKVYLVGTAALLSLAVGVSRVLLGVHYPTDVLAGWTVGIAWAVGCWAAMHVLQRRGAVEDPTDEAAASSSEQS